MSEFETTDRIDRATRKEPFAITSRAVDPMFHAKMAGIFFLALFTIVCASLVSLNPSNATQASETEISVQTATSTKSDRAAPSIVGKTCSTQAWGAWSEDCAAQLTGANKVRKISFVTVEQNTQSVNETILARFPTNN